MAMSGCPFRSGGCSVLYAQPVGVLAGNLIKGASRNAFRSSVRMEKGASSNGCSLVCVHEKGRKQYCCSIVCVHGLDRVGLPLVWGLGLTALP